MDIKTLYFHMHESVVCVDSTLLTQSCTRMANHAFWRQEKMVSKLHIHRLQFHHHPKKTAEKNTPAKTIEQMAPNAWAHFTKYVHTYLTIFDIHIWINSMRYVRHGNGSVIEFLYLLVNFGLKLLSSSPEILCYAYSSFRSTLDSWILLSLDFDNSCLLKQSHHAQFPKRSKWQLVDERFIYSSRSFGSTIDKVQHSIWHTFTMKPFGNRECTRWIYRLKTHYITPYWFGHSPVRCSMFEQQ